MIEIWKDIVGFEGKYKVSSFGNVKRIARWENIGNFGKKFFPEKDVTILKQEYLMLNLCKDSKHYWKKLHRVIAEAFIPNPENKSCVNHIDTNKRNNKISNLEWCSRSENTKHAYDLGLMPQTTANFFKKGKEAHNKKLILDLNTGIYYEKVSEAANSREIPISTLTSYLNNNRPNKTSFIYC